MSPDGRCRRTDDDPADQNSGKPAMLAVLIRVLDSTQHGESGRACDWLLASEKIPLSP